MEKGKTNKMTYIFTSFMVERSEKTNRIIKFVFTKYDPKLENYKISIKQDERRPWLGMKKDGHGNFKDIKILR